MVETIWVNSVKKSFTIDGEIKGTFVFGSDEEVPPSNSESGKNGGFGYISAHKNKTKVDVVFQLTGSLPNDQHLSRTSD